MKMKTLTLITLICSLSLVGCGGGGSGGSGGSGGGSVQQSPGTSTPAPVINEGAKLLIKAPKNLSARNIVIAVADSGVNSEHSEFYETGIDGRSASFASELVTDTNGDLAYELRPVYSDGYRPDASDTRSNQATSHGTAVASLIFGKESGITSGGNLLALDVVYSGSVDDGSFDPFGSVPDHLAAMLAVSELSMSGTIDFLNLSIEGAGTYLNVPDNGGVHKDIFDLIPATGTGIIGAAGNAALDLSEIYASNTPACTDAEMDAATGYAFERCYALKYDRENREFVAYDDDDLRPYFIFVSAVNNSGQLASFSNKPGASLKIQQRFIAAPGVNLKSAFYADNDTFITVSGTSFAAPLVTAAAGAVKSNFSSLSSKAVLQILLDTADKSFAGYNPEEHGMGILDIEKALQVNPSNYLSI
jgi:subtilisin family serine protease